MQPKNALGVIYDTLLSIPGMNDSIKIDLRLSRKQVLLLTRVIERGMNFSKDHTDHFLENLSDELPKELTSISEDMLEKAGLTGLNVKLKTLS